MQSLLIEGIAKGALKLPSQPLLISFQTSLVRLLDRPGPHLIEDVEDNDQRTVQVSLLYQVLFGDHSVNPRRLIRILREVLRAKTSGDP